MEAQFYTITPSSIPKYNCMCIYLIYTSNEISKGNTSKCTSILKKKKPHNMECGDTSGNIIIKFNMR